MSNNNSKTQQIIPPGRPQRAVERLAERLVGLIARQSVKVRLLLAAWAGFVLWMGWYLAHEAYYLTFTIDGYNPFPFYFWEDFWGLIPALFLGFLVGNPFAWLNGKRLVFGCIAFAMILGRLVSGGLTDLLLNYMPIGGSTAFWAMPFALAFTGFAVILAVGVLAVFFFGVFVAVPVAIFNQIFAFERARAVYRYQSRGLASYIYRFFLWLRNEPLPAAPPDDSRGARLATAQEVAALQRAGAPEAMAFGHIGSPRFLKTDKHVLIMASTSSGKGCHAHHPPFAALSGQRLCPRPQGGERQGHWPLARGAEW